MASGIVMSNKKHIMQAFHRHITIETIEYTLCGYSAVMNDSPGVQHSMRCTPILTLQTDLLPIYWKDQLCDA